MGPYALLAHRQSFRDDIFVADVEYLEPSEIFAMLSSIYQHITFKETNMPRRLTATKKGTHQVLKNIAYEPRVISWLMEDGWQVFTPVCDNGHQTDILISDGPNFFRIQIKTVEASGESHRLENRWKDSDVDVVVAFARNSNWGYVLPAFQVNSRRLNFESHQRFEQDKKSFLKAFHKLEA